MKKIKIALIWRVLIACVLGCLLGQVLPIPAIRIFTTFNYIFSQYIGFMVPLIIVGLVTPAICRMGSDAGKMLIFTIALAYFSSVTAGAFSYGASSFIFPRLLGDIQLDIAEGNTEAPIEPFFTLDIPALMDVTSALVLAFLVGTLLAFTGKDYLKNVIFDFEEIVTKAISVTLIPLLPIYIFGIFLKMANTDEMLPVMEVFAKIITVIFAMSLVWLIAIFCIAGAISRKNPFRSLISMLPAYLTALGTSSSAATIPVTLTCTRKCGISEPIGNFTVPLCATIHMPGSMMKITACAIAIMMLQGIPYSPGLMLRFVMLSAITAVAAPGVPGGVIMATLGVLSSVLGFTGADQALMITLYIVMDSFGTACNVMSDGAIALIADRVFRKNRLISSCTQRQV
ncbi:MAG: dicarboxylate/amino acid:cation symporter [Bacteroidales bacterium]|nr:dicarboxylate/amino acid:cation symporter [Bacteroidales bacterium]